VSALAFTPSLFTQTVTVSYNGHEFIVRPLSTVDTLATLVYPTVDSSHSGLTVT